MHLSTSSVIEGSNNKVLRDSYLMLSMLFMFGAAIALFTAVATLPAAGLVPAAFGCLVSLWMIGRIKKPSWAILSVLGFIGLVAYTTSSVLNLCLSPGNGPQVVASSLGVSGLTFFSQALFVHGTRNWDINSLEKSVLTGLVVAAALVSIVYLFPLSSLALTLSVIAIMLISSPTMLAVQSIVRGGETNYIEAIVSVFASLDKLVFMSFRSLPRFGRNSP